MRRLLPLALLTLGAAPAPTLADQAARLRAANAEADAAEARSRAFSAQASEERDAAAQARAAEAAVAERIRASEAEIAAATARVAIVDRLLVAQRVRLAERQEPILRLVAALQGFARRPAAAALLQPGSLDDAVHVRAVLGTLAPVIARRTAEVRAEIARVRALQDDTQLAANALRAGRGRLQAERLALVRMEGEHRLRSQTLARTALVESDRAIAMGERARDLVDEMARSGTIAARREDLAVLPGPLPRPDSESPQPRFATPPYRLPVAGRVATGFGEVGPNGVRSRGLTFAVAPAAPVRAPAAGHVVFARPFRGYGNVVILDHGNGWSSALIGLGRVAVRPGASVAQGAPIGRAADGDQPRLSVELRRRGVPIDLAALL
jgi:septal ring factor EnvC (AmiA/AmiB activator)